MASAAPLQQPGLAGRVQQPNLDPFTKSFGRFGFENTMGKIPNSVTSPRYNAVEDDVPPLYEGYTIRKADAVSKEQRPSWRHVQRIKMPFSSEQLLDHVKKQEQQKDHNKQLMEVYNQLTDVKKQAIDDLITDMGTADLTWRLVGLKVDVKRTQRTAETASMRVILRREDCGHRVSRTQGLPNQQHREGVSFNPSTLKQMDGQRFPGPPVQVSPDFNGPIRANSTKLGHPGPNGLRPGLQSNPFHSAPPPPPPPPPIPSSARQGQNGGEPPIIVVPDVMGPRPSMQAMPRQAGHPSSAGIRVAGPGQHGDGAGRRVADQGHQRPDVRQQHRQTPRDTAKPEKRRESKGNEMNSPFRGRKSHERRRSHHEENFLSHSDSDAESSTHTYGTDDTSQTSESEPADHFDSKNARGGERSGSRKDKEHERRYRRESSYKQHSRETSHPSYEREDHDLFPGPGPRRANTSPPFNFPPQYGRRPPHSPVVEQEPAFHGHNDRHYNRRAGTGFDSPHNPQGPGYDAVYDWPRRTGFGQAAPGNMGDELRSRYYS